MAIAAMQTAPPQHRPPSTFGRLKSAVLRGAGEAAAGGVAGGLGGTMIGGPLGGIIGLGGLGIGGAIHGAIKGWNNPF